MNEIYIFLAEKFIFLLGGAAFLIGWYFLRKNGWRAYLLWILKIGVSLLIATFLDLLINMVFPTPRPFAAENLVPLVPHAADSSFPSGHTVISAIFATFVWYLRKDLGIVFFILVILVGFGRVEALLHYPIDVLGGLVLGVGVSYFVIKHWPRKWA